jgi:histidinol dehydrogenase
MVYYFLGGNFIMEIFSSELERVEDDRYKSDFDIFSLLEYEKSVLDIILDVRNNGDKAILKYTEKYDRVKLDRFYCEVPNDIERQIDENLLLAFETMRQNIREYHLSQNKDVYHTYNENGFEFSMEAKPIDSVLVYVPGGKYTYISSLLMGCIPAMIAEVKKIYITIWNRAK